MHHRGCTQFCKRSGELPNTGLGFTLLCKTSIQRPPERGQLSVHADVRHEAQGLKEVQRGSGAKNRNHGIRYRPSIGQARSSHQQMDKETKLRRLMNSSSALTESILWARTSPHPATVHLNSCAPFSPFCLLLFGHPPIAWGGSSPLKQLIQCIQQDLWSDFCIPSLR